MEIQNLNYFLSREVNNTDLCQFLHSCINEVCNHPGPSFQQFTNIGWNEEEYNYTHKMISSLLRNPEVLSLNEAKMPQEFLDFPGNVQEKILSCLKVRREQLINALLTECSKKKLPTMTDFDWRLKMVMGSSKVSSLRELLLQLDVRLVEKNSEEILNLEMNREELDLFIKTLESVENS